MSVSEPLGGTQSFFLCSEFVFCFTTSDLYQSTWKTSYDRLYETTSKNEHVDRMLAQEETKAGFNSINELVSNICKGYSRKKKHNGMSP